MYRFRKLLLPAVMALAISAIAVGASPARADFHVTLSSSPASAQTTIFGNPGSEDFGNTSTTLINGREQIQITSFLYAGYQISVQATTNTPGGNVPGQGIVALQTANTLSVTNLSGATNPLTIDVFSDGFNIFPVGSQLIVSNSISSTELDPNSPINSSASAVSLVNGSSPTSPATLNGSAAISLLSPGSAGTSEVIVLGASPFNLTSRLTISNLALGATANVTWTTTVAAPVPAGLVLVLSGLPALGLGRWWKHRQTRMKAAV